MLGGGEGEGGRREWRKMEKETLKEEEKEEEKKGYFWAVVGCGGGIRRLGKEGEVY